MKAPFRLTLTDAEGELIHMWLLDGDDAFTATPKRIDPIGAVRLGREIAKKFNQMMEDAK